MQDALEMIVMATGVIAGWALMLWLTLRQALVGLVVACGVTLVILLASLVLPLGSGLALWFAVPLFPVLISVTVAQEWRKESALHEGSSVYGRVQAMRIVLIVLGIGLGLGMLFTMWWMSFLGIAVLVAVTFHVMKVNRRIRAQDALLSLTAAVRQNLPLSQALASQVAAVPWGTAPVLHRLQQRLSAGVSLSHAIDTSFRDCPGRAAGLIAAAEPAGRLREAMESIERDIRGENSVANPTSANMAVYPIAVFAVLLVLLTILTTVVIPKFAKMFREFGIDLPAPTLVLIDISNWLSDVWLVPLLACLLIIGLLLLAGVLSLFPRRAGNPGPFSLLRDTVMWHLPVLRRSETRWSTIEAARSLRYSVEGGLDLPRAIELSLRTDLNHHFRMRMANWGQRVHGGEAPLEALKAAGLPKSLGWAFRNQSTREIADGLEAVQVMLASRQRHFRVLVQSVVWPVVVMAMAVTVGFYVLSFMMPLIALIEHCVEMTLPT